MRDFLCFIAFFSLFMAVAVSYPLNCVAYEPFSNPNYPSNVDLALNSDLSKVSSQGFTCIKTYYSQYYGLKVADYAKKFNLKVVLGIWMEDNSFIDAEINTAIYSCKNNENVIALYTGNENLPQRSRQSIIDIKNRVRANGCNKPFGTVQTLGYYLSNYDESFINNFDFLGYNVYPFFSALGSSQPIDSLKAQITQLKNRYGGYFSKFRISETGWPTAGGSSPQGNAATVSSAKLFADAFANYMCSGQVNTDWVSYFTYFDPKYKTWAPAYERSFGIADYLGNVKWNVKNLHCEGTDNNNNNDDNNNVVDPSTRSFFLKDIDFANGDITNVNSQTPENCFDVCYSENGCQAFTWTNHNGGTCWLKNSRTLSKKSYSGAYSGIICDIKANSDVSGSVLAQVYGNDARKCCGICAKRSDCFGFAWNSFNGGTCWLKGKGAALYSNAGAQAFAS